jgi:hypothetical protein
MIFRNIDGELIEISRLDFKNDKLFYEKIMSIKKPFTKLIEKDKNNKNKNTDNNYSNYIIKKMVTNQ